MIAGIDDLSSDKVVKGANGAPILITISGNEGGTWMHRWLAIDFAIWLDLDFKIWVILL
ncbi:KilA-N domain-containing protein [Cyclobacterium marinum]|uniref:KilA-N domain-containing protein n=1 Tax=Cyclobacterium marinum TaxID=104 RepID=UPI000314D900|nr:KilA-N domain-containing protein [Cyclobacterium marinum]